MLHGRFWQLVLFSGALFLALSYADLGSAEAPQTGRTQIEMSKFSGQWFEISRIENEYQIGCRGSTSNYEPLTETQDAKPAYNVTNSCWVGDQGQEREKIANGYAWVDAASGNSLLKISFVRFFFWWKVFASDYSILAVGPENEAGQYSWAMIGHPKHRYAWILSRTPQIDASLQSELTQKFADLGYNTKLFHQTDQKTNLK